MASASDHPAAFAKAERAAGRPLPRDRLIFLWVRRDDKAAAVPVAAALVGLGFQVVATVGTAGTLRGAGLEVDEVRKVSTPGDEPSVVDLIRRGGCNLVVNTPEGGSGPRSVGDLVREAALAARIPASRRSPALPPPCTRSPTHAPRPRSPCRSGSMSRPRREPRNVVAVESVGPTCSSGSPAEGSTQARPASSSCSKPPAGSCRGRCRSASRRPGSSVSARSHGPGTCALADSSRAIDPRLRSARTRLPLDVDRPLLVGGGIGVAPLPYLGSARATTRSARLQIRVARRSCCAVPNAEVVIDPVLVTDALPRDRAVLACGPEPMLEAVRALCRTQLAWEAPMAAGTARVMAASSKSTES